MPLKKLTREEALKLQSEGYAVNEGDEVNIQDAPSEAKSSTGGSFGRAASVSALPTLASGAGFAGGMALGAALAPPTGGLSLAIPLLLGAGSAYGASKLTAKAQEQVLTDKFKEQLATDYAEHPTASTIGGLATLPLGGFNPSKAGSIAALAGLGKGVTGKALSAVERQALINAGAGAGISGAQEAVMQPLEGREFDPKSILLNTAIGGTFTKPNIIGRKLGFKPMPIDVEPSAATKEEALPVKKDIMTEAGETAEDLQSQLQEELNPEEALLNRELQEDQTKYQSDIENIGKTDPSARSFLPGLASATDKVRQKVSIPIADAGDRFRARKDQYIGKLNVADSQIENIPDELLISTGQKMREAFRNDVKPEFTPDEAKVFKTLSDYYTWNVEERIRNNQQIDGREAGKNPYYLPDSLNEEARHTLTQESTSTKAKQLKKEWAEYVVNESEGDITFDEAMKNISDYIDAMGSESTNYTAINFGAVRKAQGYGLPTALRELNPRKALISYGRRTAADMAFFKEIESNPVLGSALKLRDPRTGEVYPDLPDKTPYHTTKEVKDMMRWITGSVNEQSIKNPFLTASSRLTNNLLMGPATGLRDTASIPVFVSPYLNKFSDLRAMAKGVLNYRKERRNALETAAVQPHIDKIMLNDLRDGPNKFLKLLQKAATLARAGQGREFLENFNREITFSIGKELARDNILAAKSGHEASKKFLERFGLLVEGDITKLNGPELEAALNQVAKNFVDANQGTYSLSGLPNFTTEGPAAPFLSLTKWSIEKSNTIFKDVVKPFYTGENRIPMLTYFLGSVLTGAGIEKLNELLSNKKAADPTIDETMAKANMPNILSKISTLLQLASYGGIVGDGLKIVSDTSKGKTPRNPLSFPLYTATTDSADAISDAITAIKDGEDEVDVLYRLALDLMSQNVQSARLAINHLDSDTTERKQKFRDVRVFNELEGKPLPAIPDNVNRYENLEAKEFKKSDDPSEAIKMLPDLIRKQREKSASLEELRTSLSNLKRNSYQTFPNPETQPEAFRNYFKFLVETQGLEEAKARLSDYIRQKMVNKVKSSVVP